MALEPIKLVDRSEKRTADLVVHADRTLGDLLESGRMLYPKWFAGAWSMTYKDRETGTQVPINPEQHLETYLDKGIETFYWNVKVAEPIKEQRGRREERATRAGRQKKGRVGSGEIITAKPAALIDRALALLIDMLVLSFLTYFFAGILRGKGLAIFLPFVYYALMESSSYQASIGKLMMGLKVVDMDGFALDLKQAMIRSIVKVVTLPFSMLIYLVPLFTRYRQGLHDLAAGTMIVENSVEIRRSHNASHG